MKSEKLSKQQKRNRMLVKRIVILVAVVLLVVAILAGALGLFLHILRRNSDSVWSELPSDAFYEANYDENILENPDYLRFHRAVMYLEYGSGEELTEQNASSLGVASDFFYRYFQAIITGNAAEYQAMLTSAYVERYYPPTRFTMQMLYDIEVNQLQNAGTAEYHGETIPVYYFSVKYKIFQNNGTFRRDVGSNISTTQYYELYKIQGKLYLNAISNKQIHRVS